MMPHNRKDLILSHKKPIATNAKGRGTLEYYQYSVRRLSVMTDTPLKADLSLQTRLQVWKTLKRFWEPYTGLPEEKLPLKTVQYEEVVRVISGGALI